MSQRRFLQPRRRGLAGFSLITAIFLLVVLSGLAGVVMNLTISQTQSSALDVMGVRAYQAARAGIEWGLYQQLRNDSCSASAAVAIPAGNTLSSFTVIVECTWIGDGADMRNKAATRTLNSKVLNGILSTAGMAEGTRVFGAGIAPGTVVTQVNDANSVTMSSFPLAAGTSNLNFYSALDQWDLVSVACNKPTNGVCNNAGNNTDYVRRRMQVRF
jgi:MSHA biogenesis protein MshP